MAVFQHKANIASGGTTPSDFEYYGVFGATTISGSALDGTSVAFSTTAFTDGRVTGYAEATGAIGRFPGEMLERAARIDSPTTVTITFTGFTPGQIGTFSTIMLYAAGSATRGGKFTMQGVTKFNGGTNAVEQTFDFIADANGEVVGEWIADGDTGNRCGPAGFIVDWDDTNIDGGVPSITNINTDNTVDQYESVTVNLSNFTETITSVILGGTACTISEADPSDDAITVRVPGSLATGTYDLVVSGATETATLTGVSYTQTHARPAFDGLVDSNSILSGQTYTANTYFRFVTSFSNGTLDTSAGDAGEWANDIADYYTPDGGFTGDDTASIEFLYSDGTTSGTVPVTVTVEEEGEVVLLRSVSSINTTAITKSVTEAL